MHRIGDIEYVTISQKHEAILITQTPGLFLTPQEALELLAWLKENEEALKELAQKQRDS